MKREESEACIPMLSQTARFAKNLEKKERPAQVTDRSRFAVKAKLEVQLQPELELSRIESRRRPAVGAPAGALPEGVHIVDEGRRRSFVEAIDQVEALRDDVERHALADAHGTRQPHVE